MDGCRTTPISAREILHRFNDTVADYSRDKLLHEIFEEQVGRTPDAPAIEYEARSLSYQELNRKANQVARYLRARGIGPDRCVALCFDRGLEMIIGVLATWKAGGAYVPLDPSHPAERLSYVLQDAAPQALLTQRRFLDPLASRVQACIALDSQWEQIAGYEDTNLDSRQVGASSRNLAYVIYTSGSTGEPKGVMVEHTSAVNFWQVLSRTTHRDCRPGSRIGLNATYTFDMSLKGLLQLLSGHCVVLVPQAIRPDGEAMLRFIEQHRIDAFDSTPSQLQGLLRAGLLERCARPPVSVLLGGEPIRPAMWEALRASRGIHFFNMYGPTECTVDATIGSIREAVGGPDIGKPIANLRVYVLDSALAPVGVGAVGEICIGGVGVARGYLNRLQLTAERFLPDPFVADPHARMYRTGDLGRWRPDGTLEHLGRTDHQVKIRGFRFELGEIETQLARHAQVAEAVVVARDEGEDTRVVAYVVPRRSSKGGAPPSVPELRSHLEIRLPSYMVPSAFVLLDTLPLNTNGKVDRRALPPPPADAYATREYEAPNGRIEQLLATMWQELLRVERVGRRDNFFELGGHSFLIVQMLERLRRAGLCTQPERVYACPTVEALARELEEVSTQDHEEAAYLIPDLCESIEPEMLTLVKLDREEIRRITDAVPGGARNIQDIYPLAPLQEGILFHHLLSGASGDTYVLPMLLEFSSREQMDAFIGALQTVIDRHDALRTAVLWEQLSRPVQVVYRKATLECEQLDLAPDRDPVDQLRELMKPSQQRLDLTKAPVVNVQTAADPHGSRWFALVRLHHLLSDHESREMLLGEAATILGGRAIELPMARRYRDHVAQALQLARKRNAEGFFRSKLGDVDEPTAMLGLLGVRGTGSDIDTSERILEGPVAARLRVVARRMSVSAATLFHAAWAIVVARTSGRDDVIFGTVLGGRLQGSAGAQPMLGMFINTLPVRLRLEAVSARELIQQTQRELIEVLNHEQASLATAQRCSRVPAGAPLFNALFNFLRSAEPLSREQMGFGVIAFEEWTNYPVVMSVDDRGDRFVLTAQTHRRVDPSQLIAYLETAARALIGALEEAPHTQALDLPILPEDERRRIMEAFNATDTEFPREKLIHELFEDQVARSPDALAVVYQNERLTYSELDARANQLAHYLHRAGVRVGQYVPIVMSRSLQILIAQLAILKCGAVYVPVDPTLPVERQAFVIRDCGASHVIAADRASAGLEVGTVEWIDCGARAAQIAACPWVGLRLRIDPVPPAYVMYTSGSSGIPKGVVVSHPAVNRVVLNNGYAKLEPHDRLAYCSNPAFDASTFEVWGALLNGASMLILPQEVVLQPDAFVKALKDQRVTVLWITIGLFTQYLDLLADIFSQFRYVLTGGDVIDPEVIRRAVRRQRPQNLLAAYGPTECTTFSSTFCIKSVDDSRTSIPIGRPVANTKIYILDRRGQPVPIGVCGEIHIGGIGVAIGYLNRPELTAERFIPDPFSRDPQARLYRSGDLGRWRADGNIEFLGRNDQQVKVRGFRIELGEIETRLTSHPHVREAVVVAIEQSPGQKRLVAYITPRERQAPSADELRKLLGTLLPEYMIPSAFVVLPRLPLTASGKLDRRALPMPDREAFTRAKYQPPTGWVEETVARIWQDLLSAGQVGRNDHFFELGGHSILAMQVVVRLRSSLSVEVPVSTLFELPTLGEFCTRIEEIRRAHLFGQLMQGGADIEELLARVALMPESEVCNLLGELRSRKRNAGALKP